jgi:predicted glycoside hydrolase/deacetylase ChbG (UPF0249 family)
MSGQNQEESLRAPRRIVICADDFGMNSFVDQGILSLARLGRLGAASCMTLGPSFAGEARALRETDVDVGLHFDLTETAAGWSGMPLSRLIGLAYLHRLDVGWVGERLDRQLDAFERVLGGPPDYLDGHQHVHQLPCVLPCVLDALQRRYGARAPWLRCTLPRRQPGVGIFNAFKAQVIGVLGGHALQRAVRQRGWRSNARFLGVYSLSGGAAHYEALLRCWLEAAQDGDLMMCHPAAPASPDMDDTLMRQRAAEFEVLSHDDMPLWLRVQGLRIERMSRIAPLPA